MNLCSKYLLLSAGAISVSNKSDNGMTPSQSLTSGLSFSRKILYLLNFCLISSNTE
jgi:hypothetical protein